MELEITDAELSKRKSNGIVIICHSCKSVRNKIVMVGYKPGEKSAVMYQFCNECLKLVNGCIPCKNTGNK